MGGVMKLCKRAARARRPKASDTRTPPKNQRPAIEVFQVVVECRDEVQQQAVYERMTAEGLKCRLLML